MATTYYEKITEALANDETRLKELIQTKVHESCRVNESWLNASIRYGTLGSRPLTSEYVSASILEKEWELHTDTVWKRDIYPRVVLFKPAPWSTRFSCVRTTDVRQAVVWQQCSTEKVPTKDVYAALVPAGCKIELCFVYVKSLGPKEAPSPEKQPMNWPTKADERSAEAKETPPKLSGAADGEPDYEGLLEGQYPFQKYPSDKYPFVPTDVESNDDDTE